MLHWLGVRRLASLAFVLSLVACGGGGGGGGDGPTAATAEAPVARISASGLNADSEGAMRGVVNSVITLDASASTAPNSGVQSFAWALGQVPSGSKVSLSHSGQKMASFTPDMPGRYQITLTLTGGGQSVSKAVEMLIAEAPPVANIVVSAVYNSAANAAQVPPIDATLGSVFTLDSSQAKASDGGAVTSSWTLEQQPKGSLASIQGGGSRYQITPDLLGNYVLRAKLKDAQGTTSEAVYTLRLVYEPPTTSTMIVAPSFSATSVEQSVIDTTLGTNFVLDTSSALASDGGAVRSSWTVLQRPSNSLVALSGADARVQFRPDQLGLYKLKVRIEDLRGAYSESVLPINVRYMPPATATILVDKSFTGTTVNQPPISATLGSVFTLDTSAVRVDDGSAVSTAWQMLEQPAGSAAQLSGSGTRYQYKPDVLGTYRLKVRIQDVRGAWGESVYTLNVLNRPPEANASINTTPVAAISYGSTRAPKGATITLRGGASYDADGDSLSYGWALAGKPAGSTAALSADNSVDTTLTFDADGDYTILLRVTDPYGAYSDRQISIRAGDAPPVIVYDHSKWTAVLGSPATANAAYSYSPQGRSLSYSWTLDSRPNGSTATIPIGSAAQLSFTPDLPGLYTASLIVSDGPLKSAASFSVRVLASSSQTTELGFQPRQIRYSKSLDLLVTTSTAPNLLSIVDPFTGVTRSVPLLAVPKGLSLSPDGKLALVLYGTVVDLFDVATGARIRSSNIASERGEALLLNSGEALLYGGDQWSGTPGFIDAKTGQISPLSVLYGAGTFWGSVQYGLFADKLNTAFTVSGGLSPSKLTFLKLSPTSNKTVLQSGDWPYHGSYSPGYPIALNTSQSLIFGDAGTVARTSDLQFAGRIDLGGGNLRSVSASSDDSELLALSGPPPWMSWGSSQQLSNNYALLDPQLLLTKSTLSLPSIGSQQSYGLALFHSAADRHVGVVQTGGADADAAGKRYWVFLR